MLKGNGAGASQVVCGLTSTARNILARPKASFPSPRDAVAYIMDTFPVLKKKEKAFGEFMSKRKSLEEYDRIKTIMNAQ